MKLNVNTNPKITEAFDAYILTQGLKTGTTPVPLSIITSDFVKRNSEYPLTKRQVGILMSKSFYNKQVKTEEGKWAQHYLLNRVPGASK